MIPYNHRQPNIWSVQSVASEGNAKAQRQRQGRFSKSHTPYRHIYMISLVGSKKGVDGFSCMLLPWHWLWDVHVNSFLSYMMVPFRLTLHSEGICSPHPSGIGVVRIPHEYSIDVSTGDAETWKFLGISMVPLKYPWWYWTFKGVTGSSAYFDSDNLFACA